MKTIQLLLTTLLFFHINLYAQFVATITASKGEVNISRDNKHIKADIGTKLFNRDTIQTGKNSKAQIIFKDETIISIGKNSTFSINDYLFDNSQNSQARFGMLGGAMRVITGKIGKLAPQKFKITIKTATIGIRGTNFTLVINEQGSLEAYCTYGEISVTLNGKTYHVLQGYYITIDKNNNVVQKEFSAKTLKEMKKQYFGKIQYNHSTTSKDINPLKNDENDKQLNITINDGTSIIIQDITDESEKAAQQSKTLSSTIASYKMENATYYGSYSTSTNNSNILQNKGDVKLSINFAKDTASLKIGDFKDSNPIAIFQFDNVNKNEIHAKQEGEIGSATATFYGDLGNIVNGDFQYAEKQIIKATGNYSAKTYEELH